MLLVCSACGAREPLEGGAERLLAQAPAGQLRCPVCGRAEARLQRAEGTQRGRVAARGLSAGAPPLADLEDRLPGEISEGWWGRELMLRIDGGITLVGGLDPLRRLVVQGAAAPTDMVSRDGVSWEPLAHIPELQPFLAVRRSLGQPAPAAGRGALADASSAADGWVGQDDPTESFPRPGRSGDARRPHAAPDSSNGA